MGLGNKKVSKQGTSQPGIVAALQEVESLANEMRVASDARSDFLAYIHDRDGVVGGNHTLGVGTGDVTMIRMSGTVRYRIDGVEYVASDVEGAFAETDDVTANGNGAWRILIDKLGALTVQRATADGTGVMNFGAAEDALLSLAQLPRTANTIDIGYLMLHATNGQLGFTPNTNSPVATDGDVDVATYYNVRAPRLDNGFTVDPGAGLDVGGTNKDEYSFGTINVRTNGVNVAEISADTDAAFADNDIITTSGKFGGHLFVTNVGGGGIISLSQTGIAGSAQTVDSASSTVVQTALDAVRLALPRIFTVIGQEINETAKASFTYNTDLLDGTASNGTATFTDEAAAEFDRTVAAGTGVGTDVPAIPPATTAAAIDLVG